MKKLVHLLVAGAITAGGAAGATALTETATGTTPALACSLNKPGAAETHYANSLPVLRYGSHGTAVLGLQTYLRQQGLTYLTGTGNFGASTRQAVRHFQAKHRLPVTGVMDHASWRRVITNQFHLPVPHYRNPQLAPGASLNGRAGSDLLNLSTRLSELPWFTWQDNTSRYDGQLLASVKQYQRRVGINPSGVFGARTTASMNEAVAIAGDWGC